MRVSAIRAGPACSRGRRSFGLRDRDRRRFRMRAGLVIAIGMHAHEAGFDTLGERVAEVAEVVDYMKIINDRGAHGMNSLVQEIE